MKRVVHIAKNNKEAYQWDIQQALEMTSEERQEAAQELKRRVYGSNPPDIRDVREYTHEG